MCVNKSSYYYLFLIINVTCLQWYRYLLSQCAQFPDLPTTKVPKSLLSVNIIDFLVF